MQAAWNEVDAYFNGLLVPPDPVLDQAHAAGTEAGLPAHDVAPNQGKFLYLIARMTGARRILEIGTLAAYSTIWLARALPNGGQVVTLESNPVHAAVARSNIARAGLTAAVDLRVGRAADTLPRLVAERGESFDLVFIDADKPSNPEYLDWALRLTRVGSVIIGDNVVREGKVADPLSADPNVQGVRRFTELLAAEPRVEATALQTVGSKGWDGFALALVTQTA